MFVNGADKYLSLFNCIMHCEFLCYLPTKKYIYIFFIARQICLFIVKDKKWKGIKIFTYMKNLSELNFSPAIFWALLSLENEDRHIYV